ncbi:RNA recognition motif containing protein [Klebsormidium nitens]|uniref:Splicing factor 3B subunit 4 n=1 Tax=Klebsormidium nitens TaxID=105231 RepID=A0A0U9I6N8_KLENI|nr:RNA recognition motif containing protein [Klebsormidium nitens]|eukprot:GAQ80556.1 RNA recognition motif containing protein [Klebsormidium nitens]
MSTRVTAGVGANLLGQHAAERNQDATAYVGNLDTQVTEELLWEMFVQAGPVVNVYVPKDRVTSLHQGYGFVEFRSEEDADYAVKVMNMIKLYGKPIRVNKASSDRRTADVGANLFIGNLDEEVDEKLLHDTFSAFGVILSNPKIMRDPESGNSKGFGFISYDSFEASDAAIEAMNGQYLCNKAITVSYAFKKDTKGERHGSAAERLLASSNPAALRNRPHTLFADAPPPDGAPPFPAADGPTPPLENGAAPAPPAPASLPPPPPVQYPPPYGGAPPPQYTTPPPQYPPHPRHVWPAPSPNYAPPPPRNTGNPRCRGLRGCPPLRVGPLLLGARQGLPEAPPSKEGRRLPPGLGPLLPTWAHRPLGTGVPPLAPCPACPPPAMGPLLRAIAPPLHHNKERRRHLRNGDALGPASLEI